MKLITVVKLGGRCITDKSSYETLDAVALEKCSSSVILSLRTARMKSSTTTTTRGGRNDQERHRETNKKEENEEERRTIVVHGAGSFGHMDAKRCGLGDENRRNMMHTKEFLDGCETTRRSVQKLNAMVAESLEKNANETVIVRKQHLGDAWRFNERGEVEVVGYASVREYCEEQCRSTATFTTSSPSSSSSKKSLLLLHGDVVEDATHGRSILSGDRIALEIAKAYASAGDEKVVIRVVFITGARGVFNRDPDGDAVDAEPPCKLLRKIETTIDGWTCVKSNLKKEVEDIAYATNDSLRYSASESERDIESWKKDEQISTTTCLHDVTGGILGKIQSAVAIANLSASDCASVQAYVTSVRNDDDDDALAALTGSVDLDTLIDKQTNKPFRGTVIVKKCETRRDGGRRTT
jgi:isopentenyl phosphate kinase